eukprot:202139_1
MLMLVHAWLFSLCVVHASVFNGNRFKPPVDHRVRIAVLGAGLGGSSFVHYFHQLHQVSPAFVMDIYEKNDFIGGRTKSHNIEGDNIELGASMLIHDNQYMLNLVYELQLHPQLIKQHNKHGRTAIWNAYNKQFSFISYDSNSWLSLPYTLWHFSPKKLLDLFLLTSSFVHNINKIYQHQNTSQAIHETEQFYQVMDVLSLSQMNCLEYLYQQLYGVQQEQPLTRQQLLEKLSKSAVLIELVTGIIRANYNQNFYDMNALVCMTALGGLAGDGVNGVWSVREGNQEVSKRMIQNAMRSCNEEDSSTSQINLQLAKRIVSVTKLNGHSKYRYKVSYTYDAGQIGHKHYDVIIIAAPIATLHCAFVGFDDIFYKHLDVAMQVPYHTVYATLVEGELNQSYFEQGEQQMSREDFRDINDLLVGQYYERNEDRLFNSISVKKVLQNKRKLYRIFSRYSLKYHKDKVLNQIFASYNEPNVIEQHWNASAYPTYSDRVTFPRIVMDNKDDGLNGRIYYNNAVEAGASAMELTVISAYNLALLVQEYIASDFTTASQAKQEL